MTKRSKIIAGIVILAVLAAAFWYGGGAPGLHGWKAGEAAEEEQISEPAEGVEAAEEEGSPSKGSEPEGEEVAELVEATTEGVSEIGPSTGSGTPGTEVSPSTPSTGSEPADSSQAAAGSEEMEINPATGKDKYQTDPVPAGKPAPVEPQDVTVTDVAHTCTISIRCDTILNHMDWLDPNKVELVPEDGVILPATAVTFYEGESVFNVLQRTCRQNAIHMEFENTPMYNSAYIEGIHNLYEFDCGELSGWMYSVNGWFPNYGCSRYALKDGDVIAWVYTCDLGYDVGGHAAIGN